MKTSRIPLFFRRVGGPLAILLFAFILVWALTAPHAKTPKDAPRPSALLKETPHV